MVNKIKKYKPLFLRHSRMNTNGREIALDQQFVQLNSTRHRLHKHAHLIELQRIQQIIQLSIFLILLQLEVVLLQSMQRQLCLVIHVDLKRLKWRNKRRPTTRQLHFA